MRRALAALLGAALAGAVAPAAIAAGTTAKVTSPGSDAVLSGTVTVKGEGTATSGVDSVSLIVDGIVVSKKEPSGIQSSASTEYSWNTDRSPSGGIAPNGSHSIKVTTNPKVGSNASHTITVYTNNAPSAPTGVTASASDGTISVSWSANPEPDILGYRVERDSGSGYSTVAETGSTSFSQKPSPGTYSYRVVALRSSPVSSGGIASSPSAPAAATIQAPPPGEDGTGGSGDDGKGDGKGSGGKGSGGDDDGGDPQEKVFKAGGKVVAPQGLPRSISLPGTVGLPKLPAIQKDPKAWGRFQEKLPYDLSSLGGGRSGVLRPENVAARSPSRFIPPDGLRWVAAGVLAFAVAALLMVWARRLENEPPPADAAAEEVRPDEPHATAA